jgi:hypothetical protein
MVKKEIKSKKKIIKKSVKKLPLKNHKGIKNWIKKHPMETITIVLVLLTGFYAYQTYRLNNLTHDQFEANNRPFIYLNKLGFGSPGNDSFKMGLPGYFLTIINKGNSPSKITQIEIRSNPSKDFLFKQVNLNQWIFPDEILLVDFGKFLNVAGGFDSVEHPPLAINTTSYARVIVSYEWGEEKYFTSRDFTAPYDETFVLNGTGMISAYGLREIIFNNGGQLFDEKPPFNQGLWGTFSKISEKQ